MSGKLSAVAYQNGRPVQLNQECLDEFLNKVRVIGMTPDGNLTTDSNGAQRTSKAKDCIYVFDVRSAPFKADQLP